MDIIWSVVSYGRRTASLILRKASGEMMLLRGIFESRREGVTGG